MLFILSYLHRGSYEARTEITATNYTQTNHFGGGVTLRVVRNNSHRQTRRSLEIRFSCISTLRKRKATESSQIRRITLTTSLLSLWIINLRNSIPVFIRSKRVNILSFESPVVKCRCDQNCVHALCADSPQIFAVANSSTGDEVHGWKLAANRMADRIR